MSPDILDKIDLYAENSLDNSGKMAPYTYNWSGPHFQALRLINTKLFAAEYDTQKAARATTPDKRNKGARKKFRTAIANKSKFWLIRMQQIKIFYTFVPNLEKNPSVR